MTVEISIAVLLAVIGQAGFWGYRMGRIENELKNLAARIRSLERETCNVREEVSGD